MRDIDPAFIYELLVPDIDLGGELAAYKAGVACDIAVALGKRFLQSSDGGRSVETIDEPAGSLYPEEPAALEPPTREIDARFASIPFNPEIVTFLSFGKDEEEKPQPGIPMLENHKLEAVARTKYNKHIAGELGRTAGIRIAGILNGSGDKYDLNLRDEYLKNYYMIRADKLGDLVPVLEGGLTRIKEEHESSGKPQEESIRLCEALIDVLSICSDKLIIKNSWLEPRSKGL